MKGPGIGSRKTRFVPGWTTKERLKVDQICTLKGQGKVQGRTGLSLARSKERLKVEQVFVPGSTKERNKDGKVCTWKGQRRQGQIDLNTGPSRGRPGLYLEGSRKRLKDDQVCVSPDQRNVSRSNNFEP